MSNDDLRDQVFDYNPMVCVDPKDRSLIHVQGEKEINQTHTACGNQYEIWWYVPLVTLNEGPQRWCDDCLDEVMG